MVKRGCLFLPSFAFSHLVLHFGGMHHKQTQREKILSLLILANGGEVSSVELSKISLQYGARLKELRQQGFRIVNRLEVSGRTRHGFFRLVTGTAPRFLSQPAVKISRRPGLLFAEEAHRDNG